MCSWVTTLTVLSSRTTQSGIFTTAVKPTLHLYTFSIVLVIMVMISQTVTRSETTSFAILNTTVTLISSITFITVLPIFITIHCLLASQQVVMFMASTTAS